MPEPTSPAALPARALWQLGAASVLAIAAAVAARYVPELPAALTVVGCALVGAILAWRGARHALAVHHRLALSVAGLLFGFLAMALAAAVGVVVLYLLALGR